MQLLFGSVGPGNEEGNNLQPNAHLVEAADSLEYGTNPSAKLVIMAVIETFQINLVQIDPWMQVFEHLRGAVAVRNKSSDQTGGPGLLEHGDGPLAGNQRL